MLGAHTLRGRPSESKQRRHIEALYADMFKNEKREFPQDVYDVLNELFCDVDAYCGDPELRDDEDLDDEQLLNCAKKALEILNSIALRTTPLS